ncbi:hypothetical protein C5L14_07245 [Labrys okinawensis]|uniref:Uncharacterized protein n=1 Tax=Labrys okinawensis TaxID=346911 RepID=A0A2S9QEE7_9HYPH|nr:hypothetical protein C5L14_07245 [Labrys okinawensis]
MPPGIAGLAAQGGAVVNGVYRLGRGFESLERKLHPDRARPETASLGPSASCWPPGNGTIHAVGADR